ncbi:hypothetical protein F9C28_07445 [Shimwellia pseudoproteus]|uniref:PsiF family protein n=1 Tax=Shimwellia pseudoproteus TaxID=570012 RepID=UPI0018EC7CBD|nr:PsiF family protein [Shimwellia pseudoproteus]MBJ3814759.1 hypothetical protein [Shimwellia pseudoproteus]
MKKTIMVMLLAGMMGSVVTAQAADKPLTSQQMRMQSCNQQAGTKALKGDDRKSFMSSCLKSPAAAHGKALTPQQVKMQECNGEASKQALKGSPRKAFMSTCLKK